MILPGRSIFNVGRHVRVKKSVPEEHRSRPETSLATAVVSATLATLLCYPLDTIRRQMQLRGSPYGTVLAAFTGRSLNCTMMTSNDDHDWVTVVQES